MPKALLSVLLVASFGCSTSAPPEVVAGVAGAGNGGAAGAGAGGGLNAGAGGAGGSVAGGGAAGAVSSAGAAGVAGGGGAGGAPSRTTFPNDALAAVTLTYDDGLDPHLAVVQPALEAAGLRGTFFLSNFEGVDHDWALPNSSLALTARHRAWQAAGQNGHELASHTVNHPCNSASKAPGYKLTDYSMQRMTTELDDSAARLQRLGATPPLTFAFPCASDMAGVGPTGEDYSSLVAQRFLAARVSVSGVADPAQVDLLRVPQRDAGGKSGDELKAMVDEAIAAKGWLVLLFHGVGEEQSCAGLAYAPETCMINYLTTSAAAHETLVQYLAQKKAEVWTATFKDVATHLDSARR